MIELGTSLAYLPTPYMPIIIRIIPEIIETKTRKPCACSKDPPIAGLLYFAIRAAITGIKAAVGP